MKKHNFLIKAIIGVVIFQVGLLYAGNMEHKYTMTGHVIDAGTIEDETGKVFIYYDSEMKIGDDVKVSFFDNYTMKDRTDDIVQKVVVIR